MFKKCKKGSVCHKAFLRQALPLKNMFPCRKNPGYKTDARVYARASRFKFLISVLDGLDQSCKALGIV